MRLLHSVYAYSFLLRVILINSIIKTILKNPSDTFCYLEGIKVDSLDTFERVWSEVPIRIDGELAMRNNVVDMVVGMVLSAALIAMIAF